jgi:MFS family permease
VKQGLIGRATSSRHNPLARLLGFRMFTAGLAPNVRWNFRITLFHWLLAGVFVGVLEPYVAVVARRLGGDELTVALVYSGQFIGGVLAICGPYVLRSIHPAHAVGILWAAARLAFVAAIFINDPVAYLGMVLVWAISAMFAVPLYVGVTQDAFPRRVRGRLIGLTQAVMALVMLVTAPLAGRLMDTVGFGPVFAMAGVAGAIGAVALVRIRASDRPPKNPPPPWIMFRQTIRNRRFSGFMASYATVAFGDLLLLPTIAIVLVDTFDASFTVVGLLALVQSIAWTGGFILWGHVTDRRSGPFVVWMSVVLKIAIAGIFIVAILADNVWVLLPAYAVFGLKLSAADIGYQTSLASLARPDEIDAFSTSFWFILGLLGVGTPLLGALVLASWGPLATFIIALGIAIVGSALMGRVARGFVPAEEAAPQAAATIKDQRWHTTLPR